MADWQGQAAADAAALLSGATVTLLLTALSATLGLPLGAACAIGGRLWPRWCGRAVALYVEVIRDTPFVVQLFFVYFGLPSLGLRLGPAAAAVLAMTLNLAAYATEMVRAGLESVAEGQFQAGQALGLRRLRIIRHIVLPQAVSAVFPALGSQVVLTMLDSAVVSQIALRDLTYEADVIQARSFRAFQTYLAVTLGYLGLSFLLRRAFVLSGVRLLRRSA